MVVIFTPVLCPVKTAVRVPPRMTPTQGEVRGTVKVLSKPAAGQPAGATPETFLIFCVKKSGTSPPTRTAGLWTDAISGALPSPGKAKAVEADPAQFVWKTSPM